MTPYVDYGFIYPPAYAWFYGLLLRLREPESVIAAIAAVNLLLVIICAAQLMRLAPDHRRMYGGTLLLILGGGITVMEPNVQNPHPMVVLPIALLLLAEVMTRGLSTGRVATLVGVSAVVALLRWDWILMIPIMEAGGAALIWLAARTLRLEPEQSAEAQRMAARLWWAALAVLAGVILAMTALFGHALATGAWKATWLFVFDVPMTSYGHPSLQSFLDEQLQGLAAILAIIFIALAALSVRVKTSVKLVYILEGGAILAPCVAMLPYTFSSADLAHSIPLSAVVVVAGLTALILWRDQVVRWLLLGALGMVSVLPLFTFLDTATRSRGWLHTDIHLQHTRARTAACTGLFPADARSLFMGQTSYSGFPGSYPVLHLMRPDLLPASAFISDEVGVQSSCALGSRIASDLARALRPVILVIDTKPWSTDGELRPERMSCGKVEAAIAAMPTEVLGTCRLADREYRVMIVR